MNKETWKAHIEATESIIRPSHGGTKEAWHDALVKHQAMNCKECQARIATRRHNNYQRNYNEAMRSCGLVMVRGSISNKVYWE